MESTSPPLVPQKYKVHSVKLKYNKNLFMHVFPGVFFRAPFFQKLHTSGTRVASSCVIFSLPPESTLQSRDSMHGRYNRLKLPSPPNLNPVPLNPVGKALFQQVFFMNSNILSKKKKKNVGVEEFPHCSFCSTLLILHLWALLLFYFLCFVSECSKFKLRVRARLPLVEVNSSKALSRTSEECAHLSFDRRG